MPPGVNLRGFAAGVLLMTAMSVHAQPSFEATIRDLASPDPGTRLHAAQLLKEAAYPEAAVPLASAITDREDVVQLEAIAAELNIFLARKIVTRRRIGLVIEVRNRIAAEAAFADGPLALGARRVPLEVLAALRAASRDDNPRVSIEALYALGALGVEATGPVRGELLRTSGPDLAATIGSPDSELRLGAVRVLGRLFAVRPGDPAIEQAVGDAVIVAMNDHDHAVAAAAMEALGAMRYGRAVQALTELFEYYKRGDLARASLDALARIAYAASAPLFEKALAGNDAALRASAVDGLVRLGGRRLDQIQAAVGASRDPSLLLAGVFADVRLSNAPVDALVDALRASKQADRAREYLIEIAAARPDALSRPAQDPDARVRADVADVLGLTFNPAALPMVEALEHDADAAVARAAARAAVRLR